LKLEEVVYIFELPRAKVASPTSGSACLKSHLKTQFTSQQPIDAPRQNFSICAPAGHIGSMYYVNHGCRVCELLKVQRVNKFFEQLSAVVL